MEQTETNKFLVPAAIVVAGALIAFAVYSGGAKAPAPSGQQAAADVKIVPVKNEDHYFGSRSAKVVIVEYSDTECPFCKVYHNSLNQIMRDYDGKVAWVYRHLPIPQLHAKATKEAEATECVAELGGNTAFWQYLDKIFETTNSNDSLDPAQLPILAKSVGIGEAAFNSCLSSGKYTEAVQASATEGFASGARGTPFSLIMIDGKQVGTINGAEPLVSVKAKLDALLK
ncbi:MAG: DsbA family protein [Patescibacteria group bacterium]